MNNELEYNILKPRQKIIKYSSIYKKSHENIENIFHLESINTINLNKFNIFDKNNKIIYEKLSYLVIEIIDCLKGNMHFSGKSFSKVPLLFGNISYYYLQFVANTIVGHPHSFEPIKNINNLEKVFEDKYKKLIQSFYTENYINNFFTNDFQKGDILQFDYPVPSPKINCDITIPDTNWKINIMIT